MAIVKVSRTVVIKNSISSPQRERIYSLVGYYIFYYNIMLYILYKRTNIIYVPLYCYECIIIQIYFHDYYYYYIMNKINIM